MRSVLVVGAGNFGAATALHLAKEGGCRVTVVDSEVLPNPRSASHDVNKIVRDDYPDKLYMRMLHRAMPQWRNHSLYKQWYHEVGMLRADNTDFGENSIAAYKSFGIRNESRMLPVSEVRQRWNGAFATTNLDGLSHILYNPNVGYAEADKALNDVIKAAFDAGAEFLLGRVDRVIFGPGNRCVGIRLDDGEVHMADQVLLCTGARTGAILARSAPGNKDMHVGDRVIATGAVSFWAKLHGAQRDRFANVPVMKNCLPQVKGESMSMLSNGTIKFNCDLCFTNYVTDPATGEKMSVVPSERVLQVWTRSKFIKFFEGRARKTLDGLYGKEVENVHVEAYRMCWDASTPTHDFLISPHPHSENLYVATGGSFHGWKFLPVIGEYIAAMMDGTLSQEYADRWAWDKTGGDGHSANPTYQVIGDLQEWIATEDLSVIELYEPEEPVTVGDLGMGTKKPAGSV
ncbi:hypothetical protein S7711_06057 [Stachybotrys chartarum IBT 7711]|uniref:FAD dependent oxidoreductase domain-containing protein n=1 Tax=Stachybotrys chartarum (strain CBS 109288 / IBT 7711) TaxID=1280523 RepID=A0A084B217_STACB|nr:hypothetical protein S7711_06057 [Stachybotrys chartarum IBT 7711]KFA54790.1 hypothetical protein S40293_00767 [Stachybotrys chartarum IBT 40293]KFA76400.1 hypothetical protein S40288_04822 [Stachybotrys chartarum IBT 40288]